MADSITQKEIVQKDSTTGKYYLVKEVITTSEIALDSLMLKRDNLIAEKTTLNTNINKAITRINRMIANIQGI